MEEQNQNNGSTMDTPAEVRSTGEMATVLYGESGTAPQTREPVNDSGIFGEQRAAVPERYDLKLPDGRQVVDQPLLDEFTSVAKEFKLGNQAGSKACGASHKSR